MPFDQNTAAQLSAAFDAQDAERFKMLLRLHPSHLRDDDGADYWMWRAATSGNFPILRAMVELGADVNESHDHGDPDDIFYEPEGPILQAATFGDAVMVRWLLENGARINYVVQGMPRCLPLIRAATEGHLVVVEILVEHGADVGATWRGLNAISQAEKFGHRTVAAYLGSVRPGGAAEPGAAADRGLHSDL